MSNELTLIAAPSLQPITVAEAKLQSRVLETAEDTLIASYIAAATDYLDGRDGILGRALLTQTWEYTLCRFPPESYLCLPLAPVQAIVSIVYHDVNGADQTFSAANYLLDADKHWRPKVHLAYGASWPAIREEPSAVKVRATYGYTVVPPPLRHAIVLLVAHWFENREPVNIGNITTDLPFSVNALVEPYLRVAF